MVYNTVDNNWCKMKNVGEYLDTSIALEMCDDCSSSCDLDGMGRKILWGVG